MLTRFGGSASFSEVSRKEWSRRRVALGLALMAAGAVNADSEPRYTVGRITARGGNPIAGVEDGVILQRYFDSECRLVPAESSLAPLSGSLDTTVELDVEIISCPADAPRPAVRCEWESFEASPTEKSWKGYRHTLRVPMPGSTGIHRLRLACAVEEPVAGEPEPFAADLYVTYRPPLDYMDPPRRVWYERATFWGANLTREATEDGVVRALQLGLYAHGQRYWRYGYCLLEKHDPTQCRFGETVLNADSPMLTCEGERCKCIWQRLVQRDTPCNFGDCYVFSDVLRYMSAMMGVGGFEEIEVLGKYGAGFTTRAESRSLDPRFTGAVRCGYRGLPCPYFFGSHSLLERGERPPLYDATFGALYSEKNEAIGENGLQTFGYNVLFPTTVACYDVTGYGGWLFFDEKSRFRHLRDPAEPPLLCLNKSRLAVDSKLAAFIGLVGFSPLSTSGDERPEALAVEVEIEIFQEGEYVVHGGLYAGDQIVTLRSRRRFVQARPKARVAGPPGIYRVHLKFSGEDLVESRATGPLTLRAELTDDQGNGIDALETELAAEPAALGELQLDESKARFAESEILSATRIDPDGEGKFAGLLIDVPMKIRDAGPYAVEARLSSAGETIGYRERRLDLEAGKQTVSVSFPGDVVADKGLDGVYEVTVSLHWLESLMVVDTVSSAVGTFSAADFR